MESLFFLGDKVIDLHERLSQHGFSRLLDDEELPRLHLHLGRTGMGSCVHHPHHAWRRGSRDHLRHGLESVSVHSLLEVFPTCICMWRDGKSLIHTTVKKNPNVWSWFRGQDQSIARPFHVGTKFNECNSVPHFNTFFTHQSRVLQ